MPSKGASRTTNQSTTSTIAPVAGPAVVVGPSSTQAVLAEPAPIQAMVGAPLVAGAATVQAEAVAAAPFVPDIEDPAVDTTAANARGSTASRPRPSSSGSSSSRPKAQRCPKASGR